MYSSLQEAYQIPSFARKKNKNNGAGIEGFVTAPSLPSTKDMTGSQDIDSIAYSIGKASDYQYFSGKGLKFPDIASAATTPIPSASVPAPSVEPFDDAAPTCASSDSTYRIPISEESKKAYAAAMNLSITEQQKAGGVPAAPPAVQPMPDISGYYDDDLEQYLRIADMKAAPPLTYKPGPNDKPQPSYTEASTPFAEAMGRFEGQMHPSTPTISSSSFSSSSGIGDMFQVYILDLILFIICGLLVIFLCDQLYRLATMVGMRDTIDFIRPYVNEDY